MLKLFAQHLNGPKPIFSLCLDVILIARFSARVKRGTAINYTRGKPADKSAG
jgi:hypothetical protein